MDLYTRTSQTGRVLALAVALTCLIATSAALAFDLGGAVNKAREAATAGGNQHAKHPAAKTKTSTLPPFTGPRKRLGVMDMEVKVTTATAVQPTGGGGMTATTTQTTQIPPPADFGTGLTEMLTTALVNSGRFIVLERKDLADIQAEQALGASGAVDAASAAKTGKILGAQALIRGAVTEFNYCTSSTGGQASILGGLGLSKTSAEATVVLDIRIYDATTSEILDSVKADGHAKASATDINVQRGNWSMGGSSFTQSPLGDATRQAIDKAVKLICERMQKIPWEGRIAEMDHNDDGTVSTVYVNGGKDTGFKPGDRLEVFRAGRTIIDPQTREVLGRTKDTCIGHLRIDTVTQKLSMASVIDGAGFKIDDVLKFMKPGQQPLPDQTIKPKPAAAKPAAAPQPAAQGGAQPQAAPAQRR